MMTGAVTSRLEAVLNVHVQGPDGRSETLPAVIDTGFSGFITLPPDLIAQMGLTFAGPDRFVLADGNEALVRAFDATVVWNGRPRRVLAHEANTDALIGMALLRSTRLTMDTVEDGPLRRRAVTECLRIPHL
jgi:clan AA aspartic protease